MQHTSGSATRRLAISPWAPRGCGLAETRMQANILSGMDRLQLGLIVAFVAVGVVMLWVLMIAHFGQRAAVNPPPRRIIRRLALISMAFGGSAIAYGILVALVTGEIGRSVLVILQGLVAVGSGMRSQDSGTTP